MSMQTMISAQKRVSCCLIITDGEKLLLVNPTNHSFWEPPKGVYDFATDRDYSHAAVREAREETGLDFSDDYFEGKPNFGFVGVFTYNKKKDMAVSWVSVLPGYFEDLDKTKLVCESTFDFNGEPTPEIQGYRIATWKEANELVLPHMAAIIREVGEWYFNAEF